MKDRSKGTEYQKDTKKATGEQSVESKDKDEDSKPKEPTDFQKRLKYTLIMLVGFLIILVMGHFYITLLIVTLAGCTRN